jgi:hypothetical protein
MNDNEINLHFILSIPEANSILQALQELPAKICNPLSEKIKQQADSQIEQMKQKHDEELKQKQADNPDALVLDGNMVPVGFAAQ